MDQRLSGLLRLLNSEAETDPPHITLVNALLWRCADGQEFILLESDRDFAVPVELTLHPDQRPTLSLIDQLHDLLERGEERESMIESLLDPDKHVGHDDRGLVCIDISVYHVHDQRPFEKIDRSRASTPPLSLSARFLTLSPSKKPALLRIPCDGITAGLLTALVRIEHNLVSQLSAKPPSSPPKSDTSTAAPTAD